MKLDRPTEEQIRTRAREIFLEHGSQPGRDVENWLQAERALMQSPAPRIFGVELPKAKQVKANR